MTKTNNKKFILGIDEVGRGPLAGPVCVCGFLISYEIYKKIKKNKNSKNSPLYNLKDSKKLSIQKRSLWFKKIKKWKRGGLADFVCASQSAKTIDKIGIKKSINICIEKIVQKLEVLPNNTIILLDGSLFAPDIFKNQKTIIKGDEKEPVISLASIVAKNNRDAKMIKLSKKYKKYFFEKNVGYGTKEHLFAIKKHGLSKIHRKTFCKRIV